MYCDRRSTHRDGSRRCNGTVTAAPHAQRHTQARCRTESAASRYDHKVVGDGRSNQRHGTTPSPSECSHRGTAGTVPLGRAPASSGADPSSISVVYRVLVSPVDPAALRRFPEAATYHHPNS
jgi:hypothetical protein